MDRYYASRQTARKPFADMASRSNASTPTPTPSSQRAALKPTAVSPLVTSPAQPASIPHNESLIPTTKGTLKIRNPDAERKIPPRSPGHRRVAELAASETQSKRDSACSTVSNSSVVSKRKSHIGPWQLGKTIGRGGCSQVRAVRHSVTGQYGAAKIIEKAVAETVRAISLANLIQSTKAEDLYPEGRAIPFGLEREIVIMKLLDHKNIVRLFDVWENRNEIYLVMEYVEGGELFNYISDRRGLDEDEAVYLFRQIIAALLYCHRINIHHRDLKPENILLDKNTHQIKLVDFGMAALQPIGKHLSTPCGSPHYAAPEVIRSKSYDGGQADVWSCGVILFVMLAGYPPFQYSGDERDLKELFRQIVHAEYTMPDSFGPEAADLISRILVPDPAKRIRMEDIWDHPLLHKYDDFLGLSEQDTSMAKWVGPNPHLDDWEPLERQEIDREILRNMRVLWHSEKEETLINQLLNDDLNHEKFFYGALMKHRIQHLEDYSGFPGAIEYSNSDYHHERTPDLEDPPPLPSMQHSQSAYSIMNNEHLTPKHSFYEIPASEKSYDPFRSSRDHIVTRKDTNGRRSSLSANGKPKAVINGSNTLRVQTLRRTSKRQSSGGSVGATSPPSKRNSVARKSVASSWRTYSKASITSSVYPSSPPVFIKPRVSYKKGVSFAHLRRPATNADAWMSDTTQDTDDQQGLLQPLRSHKPDTKLQKIAARPSEEVTSRKLPITPAPSQARSIRYRKPPPTPHHYINQDVRKVSTELEQLCNEAFKNSSEEFSMVESLNDKPGAYDTPPTSISKLGSSAHKAGAPLHTDAFQHRPLPPLPDETPKTFIARELAETRARLMKRYQSEGETTNNFNEALKHLDELLKPSDGGVKRAVSAPSGSDYLSNLPAISEEDHVKELRDGHRSVTDPVHSKLHCNNRKVSDINRTIRVVDPSSPTPIAPLNVRKVSGASAKSSDSDARKGQHLTVPQIRQGSMGPGTEHDDTPSSTNAPGENGLKKKRSWLFRLGQRDKDKDYIEKEEVRQEIPKAWQGLDDRIKTSAPPSSPLPYKTGPTKLVKAHRAADVSSHQSSEFPMRQGQAPRKGFLRFFSKWTKHDPKILEFDSANDMSTTSLGSSEFSQIGDGQSKAPVDYQSNWLARFLHIKPATQVLCFHIGRGRARQEMVRLLRDWKRFGVRDVRFDRAKNTVSASVGKDNHLSIRPVTFMIELYTILEHGRRAQLCVARFTQTKGAASSFKKIVDVLADVCNGRGLLVEDEQKKNDMMEVFGM
ncbi:Pkinase-domain-containing protein [Pseudovirgaria hyperparasitica]|uniref:non-specific serine/threonine protein kinase n=1 Tax=Pseudovirgaria hyperparasitica TaxID=470096 RepID=A0A6A6VW54_9PEZI|nr:Pkinase-domain-containing protein [Pseudovirgaria hyperparasitica]KAF2753471.1 Pkinase-domain-containing protein [Pseudovirgaria hyperparasitica]